jgi:uncharacterized protein
LPLSPIKEGSLKISMRRKHNEIKDPKEITRILTSANIGRFATIDAEGYPYITPVNFVSYEGCVYFHCAPKGEKLDNLSRDPRVCFEVDIPLAYLEVSFNPGRNPCQTHQLYHSVIIKGTARVVPDGDLKTAALNALVARHEGNWDFPLVTSEFPAYKACCVIEIKPEKMTGKSDLIQNKTDADKAMVAKHLVERGLPGDLDAVRAMGSKIEGKGHDGW